MSQFVQDPGEILDYTINWGERVLAPGETIATSTVTGVSATVGTGAYASTNNATSVTFWVVGGLVVGQPGVVTNRITTSSTPPRTYERSILIAVKDL